MKTLRFFGLLSWMVGAAYSIKFFVIGYDQMKISDCYYGLASWIIGAAFQILAKLNREH